MSGKTLNTRIQNKRGTTAEWATGSAPNFVPKDGEIVAYTDVHRIKIGDGTTKVSALPFVDKVRDVTLGGESMVNANGVVELQQTEMTDGYIPVWDNTEKIFKDGYNRNNVVTTDTAQTISGKKTFGGEPPVFDTGFTATAGTTFDADAAFNTELDLNCPIRTNNSLGTLGQVLVSQGTSNSPKWSDVPTPSNMVTTDTEQNIFGAKTFTSGSNYPQNIVDNGGMRIYSSPSVITSYSSTAIVRVNGSSPSVINLPSSGGTLALTSDIPIKTATLSGTTLSITLS